MLPARGLFHKAIILSGTILDVNTESTSEVLGKAVLKELGITNDNIEKINDISYEDLYNAGQKAMTSSISKRAPRSPMMLGFVPTPDGQTLLNQVFQPNKIKIMIGTKFNEL